MSAYGRVTWRDQLIGMLFAMPFIIGVAVLLMVPLGLSFYYSFCHYTMLTPPIWVGPKNYIRLLSDHAFMRSLLNTCFFSIMSVPLSLAWSLLLALLLNVPNRLRNVYRTIVFLPSLLPLVATAVIWRWMLSPVHGPINFLLKFPCHWVGTMLAAVAPLFHAAPSTIHSLRHLKPPLWLEDGKWAMATIILLSLWGVGQTVIIFLAGLDEIPQELYESAALDGATGLRRLWHVTLPMLSPVIFFNLVIGIIGSWQIFDLPYVMTQGGPGRATLFYSMYLFEAGFQQLRMGAACAMAWVQLIIILILTVIAFRSSKKWVHYR
ncbi:MAG: carbohydrate ABC transporter permease [Phycisphaerae bacterium]